MVISLTDFAESRLAGGMKRSPLFSWLLNNRLPLCSVTWLAVYYRAYFVAFAACRTTANHLFRGSALIFSFHLTDAGNRVAPIRDESSRLLSVSIDQTGVFIAHPPHTSLLWAHAPLATKCSDAKSTECFPRMLYACQSLPIRHGSFLTAESDWPWRSLSPLLESELIFWHAYFPHSILFRNKDIMTQYYTTWTLLLAKRGFTVSMAGQVYAGLSTGVQIS